MGEFGAAEARTDLALGPPGLVPWGRMRSAAEFSDSRVLQMRNYEIYLVFIIKEVLPELPNGIGFSYLLLYEAWLPYSERQKDVLYK